MSLILPYFKMDVIDWLKSERIEGMSSACVGAYIFLLCEAWTRPMCSLPASQADLMRLARWTGTTEEFFPVLQCFEPLKGDRSRLINHRLKREWDQAHATVKALSEAGKRGAQIKQQLHQQQPKPTNKLSVRKDRTDDFEQFWLAYPKKIGKKDALKAWSKASDKPEIRMILDAIVRSQSSPQWTKEQGQFIPNPATWLNQGRWTDQPLNGHTLSGPLTCPHHPTLTFTDRKAFDTHNFCHHPKYEG